MPTDNPAAEPGPPSAALNADALSYLHALGRTIRAAPLGQHQSATIHLIVETATRYRADGASWISIARALGVDPEVLRKWRRIPDAKPVRSLRSRPRSQISEDPPSVTPITTMSGSITQTQSSTINQHSNQLQIAGRTPTDRIDSQSGLIRPRHLRCALVVSGDARPGGNDFSLETAEIRQRLGPAQIDVREVSAVELTEIAFLLDNYEPAVFHICAHSAFGGVYLPLMGETSAVAHAALWDTINAARRPPRLVVLNLCSWPVATYGPGTVGVESLICWPAEVDDDQGRLFSGLLHSGLVKRTVGQAFHDARRTVCDRWPQLEPPKLCGSDNYRIF